MKRMKIIKKRRKSYKRRKGKVGVTVLITGVSQVLMDERGREGETEEAGGRREGGRERR